MPITRLVLEKPAIVDPAECRIGFGFLGAVHVA
jgi:hypothetical protein